MAKHFLITAAAVVTFFDRATQAKLAAGEGDFVVSNQEDLMSAPGPLLISVYNDAATKGQGKTITKFSDKETAARRVFPTLDFLAKAGTVPEGAAKAPRAKKERTTGSGVRGRTSQFAGHTITKLVDGNPRREGTLGYNSWALIRNGMSFESYINAGGRLKDLAWDISYNRIKMERAG